MEAKDTVMDDDKLRQLSIEFDSDGEETGRYTLAPFPDLVRSIAQAQSKISFQAGIKEVVKWIENTKVELDAQLFFEDEWQAKLKEWGIGRELTNTLPYVIMQLC